MVGQRESIYPAISVRGWSSFSLMHVVMVIIAVAAAVHVVVDSDGGGGGA